MATAIIMAGAEAGAIITVGAIDRPSLSIDTKLQKAAIEAAFFAKTVFAKTVAVVLVPEQEWEPASPRDKREAFARRSGEDKARRPCAIQLARTVVSAPLCKAQLN